MANPVDVKSFQPLPIPPPPPSNPPAVGVIVVPLGPDVLIASDDAPLSVIIEFDEPRSPVVSETDDNCSGVTGRTVVTVSSVGILVVGPDVVILDVVIPDVVIPDVVCSAVIDAVVTDLVDGPSVVAWAVDGTLAAVLGDDVDILPSE